MARKPRIKRRPPTVLPTPRYCQYPPGCAIGTKPSASLTFRSRSGLVWTQASCPRHQTQTVDFYRQMPGPDGGDLIETRLLEEVS